MQFEFITKSATRQNVKWVSSCVNTNSINPKSDTNNNSDVDTYMKFNINMHYDYTLIRGFLF